MKKIHRALVGIILSIVALILGFSAMSDQAGAKTKIVTTKNGTKLYCSGDKQGRYEVYDIENAKKDLIIPETVDGTHKIDSFDSEEFPECKEVERIHFPSEMKYIYDGAETVEDYPFNMLNHFPNLKKVSFDKKNRYYSAKNGVVYDKKKRLVAIAPGISKVKVASWVTGVTPNAYADLTKLEDISVEKGNKKYKSIKGALYSKDGKKLLYYPIAKKDTVFRVPGGVEEIGEMACFGQKYMKELIMGNSVHEIGEYAFAWCSSLKKVSLNKKLKILNVGAFYNYDKNWLTLSLPAGIEEVEIGSLPVKVLEIPAGVKRVMLDEEDAKIRAQTLIVRSLSLDVSEISWCSAGKTIYAYKDSRAYQQLKDKKSIKLIALKE